MPKMKKKGFLILVDIENKVQYGNGYHETQRALGWCLYNGIGTPQNYKKAFEYYTIAIYNGNKPAMSDLAAAYGDGNGCDKNSQKMFSLYEKSANAGSCLGMINVAMCYGYGDGVVRDWKKGKMWYEKARKQGCERKAEDYAIFDFEANSDVADEVVDDVVGDVVDEENNYGMDDYGDDHFDNGFNNQDVYEDPVPMEISIPIEVEERVPIIIEHDGEDEIRMENIVAASPPVIAVISPPLQHTSTTTYQRGQHVELFDNGKWWKGRIMNKRRRRTMSQTQHWVYDVESGSSFSMSQDAWTVYDVESKCLRISVVPMTSSRHRSTFCRQTRRNDTSNDSVVSIPPIPLPPMISHHLL